MISPLYPRSFFLVILVAVFLYGCASPKGHYVRYTSSEKKLTSPATKEINSFVLNIPQRTKVDFRGEFDFTSVKGAATNGIMYPANSAEVLVASLITHAIIQDSIKSQAEQDVIDQANQVLAPFSDTLDTYFHENLVNTALPFLSTVINTKATSEPIAEFAWLIDSKPVFYLRHDQRQLVVKNIITISRPSSTRGNDQSILYQNMVEVYSSEFDSKNTVSFLKNNAGENLKGISSKIFAQSLTFAVNDFNGSYLQKEPKQKTIRYTRAGENQYERAYKLVSSCDTILMRTLRGWIKSVPVECSSPGSTATLQKHINLSHY